MSPRIDNNQLLEMIRQGLQGIVESIPHGPTATALSTPLAGSTRMAQERRVVARRSQRAYRPRVLYRVKRAAPKRHPLPETDSKVYATVKRSPSKATARWLRDSLNLTDGQVWSALQRLCARGILTSKPAR